MESAPEEPRVSLDPEGERGDVVTLRFVGKEGDATQLHELHAAHVAEVLQGLVGLAGDFSRAGAFGSEPVASDVLVRPAREGSFIIEVVREVVENAGPAAAATGVPSLSAVIWWATKSIRAGIEDFEYLDNGNVKVKWQDGTAQEIPKAAWDELNKRKRRRKRHLHQIMTPLSDDRVAALEAKDETPPATADDDEPAPITFILDREDYVAVRPSDEVKEDFSVFEVEGQMSAVDFDDAESWRVKTKEQTRKATMADDAFLGRIANGLAVRKSDIFRLEIREDIVEKNGRTRRYWTILKVVRHKRAAHDDDA